MQLWKQPGGYAARPNCHRSEHSGAAPGGTQPDAQAMEAAAERGSSDLQPAPAAVPVSVPVNAVGKQQRTRVNEDPECFRCGGKHMATACK